MTSRLLARRLKVDVSPDADTWTALTGCTGILPNVVPAVAKRITFADGWGGAVVLSNDWTLVCQYNQLVNGTTRAAGQAIVEAREGETVADATLNVRWYDRNGLTYARQGLATVTVTRQNAGVADLDRITVTFTGDGELLKIANPLA